MKTIFFINKNEVLINKQQAVLVLIVAGTQKITLLLRTITITITIYYYYYYLL
jgi:hypothetical protein